ncbi:MAG: dihydrofolate reductase [Bacteroidia bacterium]
MIISLIVAASENNVIGKNNQLIWKLNSDMRFFREKTIGHHIIMGRKTFESTGVLPKRTSIIVSRNSDLKVPENCLLATSIEDAISKVKNDEEAFIIGGAEIYKQSLELADKIYLTRVHHSFVGDAFFPEIDETKWELISKQEHHPDEKNQYAFTFLEYRKK